MRATQPANPTPRFRARRTPILIAMAIAACAASAVLVWAKIDSNADPDDPLIVHEWGTFTSFSGSNGVKLDYRPLVGYDLPYFVYGRSRQAGYLRIPFLKNLVLARQRMETPVVYFYTRRPREVEVSVDFPAGLLTEFYPPVARMTPAFELNKTAPLKNSRLDWGKIRLLPAESLVRGQASQFGAKPPAPPAVGGHEHYQYARETDAAMIEFRGKSPLIESQADEMAMFSGKKKPSYNEPTTHYEKFLFYRGVGNFKLPLTLQSHGQGRFSLRNEGRRPVRSLFLVSVREGKIRFSEYDQIAANAALELTLPAEPATVEKLSQAIVARLTSTGLYVKEARAMVKTWRSSWFGEEGERLLYFVPSPLVEKTLPLHVTPRPAETVRVLVGRLETMSLEEEAKIVALIRETFTDETEVSLAQQTLIRALQARFGRFAEPALKRVRQQIEDADLRRQVDETLKRLTGAV